MATSVCRYTCPPRSVFVFTNLRESDRRAHLARTAIHSGQHEFTPRRRSHAGLRVLLAISQVVETPHVASSTPEFWRADRGRRYGSWDVTPDQIRTQLAAVLAGHAEIELAMLFGSRARGDARPGSDVDIAVVGRAIDTLGLADELGRALGAPVDVVDVSDNPPIALLLAVLRDGRRLHEGRPGAHGRFLSHSLMDLETDLPAYRAMQRSFLRRVAERGLGGGR
jgi:predicted nucleotidyltransferase